MGPFDSVKFKGGLEKLRQDAANLKISVETLVNPNHRHDEEHEKAEDHLRTEIAKSHRFESFAKERNGCNVKWHIDGHDYFYAVSELIDRAEECVFILDWWLSPELYLRRPPSLNEEWRLDRLLRRKAEQGVKIYVVVYKEVTQTMTMSSAHTKHALEALHSNIACMRHPDHLGGEITLYWSHHEKLVIVDNVWACVGGLDLCFGRWDSHTFPLADAHPTDFDATLFPGQDFNNARIQDFQQVDHWTSNQQSRLEIPRMPWHDVHMSLEGPVVLDLAQHFVERWNEIRKRKYSQKSHYPQLDFPHVVPDGEDNASDEPIVRHPHWEKFRQMGEKYTRHAKEPHVSRPIEGNMRVQALRSSADWSSGILTEHSIQNAYIQLIREANHFIYIENQFFITNTQKKGPVENQIGAAIAERVIQAARDGKKFKVFVLIPAVPGFAGDIQAAAGTLAIMDAQFRSIDRGDGSIFEKIRKEGFDPREYISFYNLRSFDRINNDPKMIAEQERVSGVSFFQAQAALARLYLGDSANSQESDKNAEIEFTLPPEGGDVLVKDTKEKKEPKKVKVPLPKSVMEARDIIKKFQEAAPRSDRRVADSVAHHALQSGSSVKDEPWEGDEESEKNAFVTEELYIHSKLLIVDDRRVIMGSANLNDRSMNGDHDSEIALCVEDQDMIESEMNGEKYYAGRFAATLRRRLCREHLGLIKPQLCLPREREEVTPFMQPIPVKNPDAFDTEEDRLVRDPLSDQFQSLWKTTAQNNTERFHDVFHSVPSDKVRTWDQYKEYIGTHKVGHIYDQGQNVQQIKEAISQIRGHLVEMPLDFLRDAPLRQPGAEVNPITLPIYL